MAHTQPTVLVPNVRGRFLAMMEQLADGLVRNPERGREELRGILGIRLRPDESGPFLWAEYSLGMTASLPKQENADIVVAGTRYSDFRRRRALRRAA
jgi:hypothetical protein